MNRERARKIAARIRRQESLLSTVSGQQKTEPTKSLPRRKAVKPSSNSTQEGGKKSELRRGRKNGS